MPDEERNKFNFDPTLLSGEAKRAFLSAYRVTKSSALAEDVVQEAYETMLRQNQAFEGAEHLKNVFLAVVHQKALMLLRSEKSRRRREETTVDRAEQTFETADEEMISNELAVAARSALNQLPLAERAAVSLCCEQGLTLDNASKILGIGKSMLHRRVNRGLAKLRKILAQQGYSVATPLAVGTALSSLSLPVVPATLMTALQNLAANPALAAAKAAKLSAKALSQTVAKKTAVWLAFGLFVGVAAIAGGIWYWSNLPQNSSAVSKTETAAQPPIETPKERNEASENTDRFYRRWTFENGLPEGFAYGEVNRWVLHKGTTDGKRDGVAPSGAASASFSLPCRIPSANSSVMVKAYRLNPNLASGLLNSFGFEGKKPKSAFWLGEPLSWNEEPLGTRNAVYVFETFCIGGWAITLCDGKLTCITRYEGERVSLHGVGFGLISKNLVLEELELRELKNEEIPEFIRDPEKLVKERGLVLRDAKDLDRKRGEP